MSSDETEAAEQPVTETDPALPEPVRWDAARVAFVVCLLVMVVSLCWNANAPSGEADATEEPTDSEDTGATGQTDDSRKSEEAGDGGELTIVESGYTRLTDLAGDHMVSWGLIVENTSKKEVATSQVSYEAVEADGDKVSDEDAWDNGVDIFALKPGERIGVGATSYLDVPKLKKLTFHFAGTVWRPDSKSIGSVTAEKVSVKRVGKGDKENYWSSDGISFPENTKGRLRVKVRVESGYQDLLSPALATAIYRDADGEIVGASDPEDFESDSDLPPGWSVRTIEVNPGPPDSTVDKKVEVYAQGAVHRGLWG